LKKRYNIKILEQDLSVLSDAEDEHVANVVRFVNEKMEEVLQDRNGLKTLDVAILAALNISEDFLKLKEVHDEICDQLENRSEKLIQLIEDVI
jgi:cell division protein ZapA